MNTLTINSKKNFSTVNKSFVALIVILFSVAIGGAQDNRRNVIKNSNFIFSGTIVRMNASNIEIVPDVPTAIVRVDEVIEAVSPYEQMRGKEITVLLASTKNRRAGAKQVFFTSGWYYGKTLGVKETPNNLVMSEKVETVKNTIVLERVNIRNDSIREELNKAALVVWGTVVETNIKIEKIPGLESEHDPEFRKAIIQIKEVLKGQTTEKRVEVIYASSEDVMWHNSPKLAKGQEGIFLLQLRQAPAIYKINGYTVLDKRDVLSTEDLSNVRNLLKN
jgi:hypothetical protein